MKRQHVRARGAQDLKNLDVVLTLARAAHVLLEFGQRRVGVVHNNDRRALIGQLARERLPARLVRGAQLILVKLVIA